MTTEMNSNDSTYIPKDIDDCFEQLDRLLPEENKSEIRAMSKEEFVTNAHFGIGMWMRNNWQLWRGSKLSKYYNDLGIHHEDDMTGIITTSHHRHLIEKEMKREIAEELQKMTQNYAYELLNSLPLVSPEESNQLIRHLQSFDDDKRWEKLEKLERRLTIRG